MARAATNRVMTIGLTVGTYSSIFVATPFLAAMHEREPAMKALSKRVNARTGKADVGAVSAVGTTASTATGERGPRNQPKRKKTNKRK